MREYMKKMRREVVAEERPAINRSLLFILYLSIQEFNSEFNE